MDSTTSLTTKKTLQEIIKLPKSYTKSKSKKHMAALQAQRFFISTSSSTTSSSSSSSSNSCHGLKCRASLQLPFDLRQMIQRDDLKFSSGSISIANLVNKRTLVREPSTRQSTQKDQDSMVLTKFYAIMDAVSDRAEMHDIIGRQRDNWNHLFLHSINSLTLTATLMAALAPSSSASQLSTGVLLAASAAMMSVVNKIQPSQLAEEQRKSAQLWKQLERELQTMLKLRAPTKSDIEEVMNKVLALDKAYPLPLLPGMLEKFPKTMQPSHWWPSKQQQQQRSKTQKKYYYKENSKANGWSQELEDEMEGVLRVLKMKDEQEYMRVGSLVLQINKCFAVSGPVFAGLGAVAAMSSWSSGAVVLGALAAVVNTMEHGGQLGMIFELLRNVAGYYRKLQEEIESALGEEEVERRENGEMFEMKMALQLGRSPSDLRQFAKFASPSVQDEDVKDFAGKLF